MAKTKRNAPAKPISAEPTSAVGDRALPARFLAGLALVLAVTAFVYLPALDFGFVYDDREQILQNSRLRLPDYPSKAFREDLWRFRTPNPDQDKPGGQYYRPVFALYLWANWQQFGDAPRGWHLTSLLLHLANTILVGILALRLRASPNLAVAAALLFGLHPIHAESVAWVAGSTDLLLALFTLGALLLVVRNDTLTRLSWPRRIGSLGLFALAAFTKETAYVFPVLFAAVRWREEFDEVSPPSSFLRPFVRSVAFSLPYGAIALAVFLIRLRVIGFLAKPLAANALDGRQTLLTLPRVLVEYVSMTLLSAPAGLGHPIHPPAGPTATAFWLPLAVLAFLAVVVVRLRPHRFASAPLLAAGLVLPLVPVLNLRLVIPDALVQDRYLYLTTAFAIPAIALALEDFAKTKNDAKNRILVAIGLVAIVAGVRLTILRDTFRDEIALFTRATSDAPSNGIFQHRLGLALLEAGRSKEAIARLERAVELDPNDWVNEINLALAYGRSGNLRAAVDHQARALAIAERTGELAREPRFATIFAQRAAGLEQLGDKGEAEKTYRRATEIDPNLGQAWEALTRLAFERRDHAEAERLSRKMIELAPQSPEGWGNLGSVLTAAGKLGEAEKAFQKAQELSPARAEADLGLAQVYLRMGKIEAAREAVRSAIRKAPENTAVRRMAGEIGVEGNETH